MYFIFLWAHVTFETMEDSYYKKYYSFERNHWWFLARANILRKVIRKYIPGIPALEILNTGIATGRTSEILAEFGRVTSVESDAACCRFVKEALQMEVTEASVTSLPFSSNLFDMVCAWDVLEHVREHDVAVRELHRVTKTDGWLVVTVPAYAWLWSQHDDVNHHYRRYTRSGIKKIIQDNGFRIEYFSGFNTILFLPIAAFRLATRPFRRKNSKPRSDFEIPMLEKSGWTNKLFYFLFNLEARVMPAVRFPAGVSLMVVARKV
jgi:2-polyprenyl-3-methyl-5-hydroxy-6-metoxy-1,4-benzoquinol methylase